MVDGHEALRNRDRNGCGAPIALRIVAQPLAHTFYSTFALIQQYADPDVVNLTAVRFACCTGGTFPCLQESDNPFGLGSISPPCSEPPKVHTPSPCGLAFRVVALRGFRERVVSAVTVRRSGSRMLPMASRTAYRDTRGEERRKGCQNLTNCTRRSMH